MSATIREIVNQALTVVGEVSGPGVQMYEDDRMKADAVRAFNMMFKKYPWQQYLKWFTVALDGVSGKTFDRTIQSGSWTSKTSLRCIGMERRVDCQLLQHA